MLKTQMSGGVNMSNVNVQFLGADYSIPEELKEFIGYLHEFEGVHNSLMPLLTSQINKKEYSGGADVDFAYWKNPLSNAGQKIISKLAKQNIFDVTLDDIVFNNKGYLQLHSVCSETMQGMVNILMSAMENWLDGYERAYNSAASNITGSGVSVWTSSLSSALIYSAMEASTIKKQADKADMQYRTAMQSLSTNIDSTQKKQETELLANKYYPGVAESLGLFVSEMMEFYVNKLEQHGVFAYSKVKGYNLKRSSDLLKNISLVPDKAGLLKEAFLCCPYNPDIYNAVLDNGLADVPTFETAKYFMQDGLLVDVIEKYAKNNIRNADAIQVPVKVLALYKGKDEASIWKELYSTQYSKFHQYYAELNRVIKERRSLISWIENNITSDAVKLCDMDKDSIASAVKSALKKKVITDKQFTVFKDLGMLDKEFCVSSTDSLDEINAEYVSIIADSISKFIPEVKANIEKYREAADNAKQKYESEQSAYYAKLKELQDEESALKQNRSSLGLFAFSKKKEMDAKIAECQSRIAEHKKNDNTTKLRNEYERMCTKLHSIEI